MVQPQTYLKVADNSGAKQIMVIHVFNRSFANIGDRVVAVVKEAVPNNPIKKSDIVQALVVRSKKGLRRKDSWIRFADNAAVIIQKDSNNPRGSRIFGALPRELRDAGYLKIISLAPEVL